ncbi:YggT family protein [Dokdonella koreensis]|uniref:Integral membrane protein n=1 Tax=Dokdonella koreensis DS-123 TaxID=1300342 RepID=A0A161HJG5_9GAMM|nr:YggT family protein [Dokdonella koreensis]ANB16740.1 Putative integral membrane protein [Dokdonella koreensis DS-123]
MSYFADAGQILIRFIFGVLIALVVLRVLLQWVRANFYNPICQFLYKATNPVLMPLRRLIPAWRTIDIAGIALAWLLCAIKLALLFALAGIAPAIAGLAVMALADLIGFVLLLYLGLILVRIILSFFAGNTHHPIVPLVYQLTDPVLRPLQRALPAFGGIDFSPMIAWLLITLARVLLVQPLLDLGSRLAQGG